MWLGRFLFAFILHLITADANTGVQVVNKSQGKIYLYFKKTTVTSEEAMKVCRDNKMRLMSAQQQVDKHWWDKIIGSLFHGSTQGQISAFICEKDDVSRINNFKRYTSYPFKVSKISSRMGSRLGCAVQCSGTLHCDIFIYASNYCWFNEVNTSGSIPSCSHRMQCYVKVHGVE